MNIRQNTTYGCAGCIAGIIVVMMYLAGYIGFFLLLLWAAATMLQMMGIL